MTELEQALADLAKAEAELAKAEAELKAAEAKAPKRPAKKTKPKRAERPIHHPESNLRSERYGYGGPMPSDERYRFDMTPVVTKELDPMERPEDYKYVGRECLYLADLEAGRTDSDSWKRCMCANCVDARKDV